MGGFVFIYCLSMQSPHGCQLEARWHDNSLATVSCLLEARWHDNSLVLCHASVLLAGIHKFFSAIHIRRGIRKANETTLTRNPTINIFKSYNIIFANITAGLYFYDD